MKAMISQRESVDSHGTQIDVLEADYVKYFKKMDVNVWAVSNFVVNVEELFEQDMWDFVILTGGGSVPRAYYDCDSMNEPEQTNRDWVESQLVKQCIQRKIPILAICRGMQFINGMFGGKISRLNDLSVKRQIGIDHEVWYEPWRKEIKINNFHNDGIKKDNLAKAFQVLAEDRDNQIIEAYCSDEWKIYGIQWHPERRFESRGAQDDSRSLVNEFIKRYVEKE